MRNPVLVSLLVVNSCIPSADSSATASARALGLDLNLAGLDRCPEVSTLELSASSRLNELWGFGASTASFWGVDETSILFLSRKAEALISVDAETGEVSQWAWPFQDLRRTPTILGMGNDSTVTVWHPDERQVWLVSRDGRVDRRPELMAEGNVIGRFPNGDLLLRRVSLEPIVERKPKAPEGAVARSRYAYLRRSGPHLQRLIEVPGAFRVSQQGILVPHPATQEVQATFRDGTLFVLGPFRDSAEVVVQSEESRRYLLRQPAGWHIQRLYGMSSSRFGLQVRTPSGTHFLTVSARGGCRLAVVGDREAVTAVGRRAILVGGTSYVLKISLPDDSGEV